MGLEPIRRHYLSASISTGVDQRIATAKVVGVFSQGIAMPLLADCQADLETLQAQALVADYSGAVLALNPDTVMATIRKVIGNGGALSRPTALVVSPDTLPFWRNYALNMAQHGIVRGVFTDANAALAWAREQAAVHASMLEAQARYERRAPVRSRTE